MKNSNVFLTAFAFLVGPLILAAPAALADTLENYTRLKKFFADSTADGGVRIRTHGKSQ